MIDKEAVAAKIKDAVAKLLADTNTELIELICRFEGGRFAVRFLVDRPGGISVGECAELNNKISYILDGTDIIQESYVLEVSSPGLDRPLKTKRDFERVLGKKVRFHLKAPVIDKIMYVGAIERVDEDKVYIKTKDGFGVEISMDNVAKAQEEIEF